MAPLIFLSLTALFSGLAIICLLIALRAYREHRNNIFPVVREDEGIKARRSVFAIVFLLFLTLIMAWNWIRSRPFSENAYSLRDMSNFAFRRQNTAFTVTLTTVAAEAQTNIAQTSIPSNEAADVAATLTPTWTPSLATPSPSPTGADSSNPTPSVTTAVLDIVRPITISQEQAIVTAQPTLSDTKSIPDLLSILSDIQIGPVEFTVQLTEDRQAVNPAKTFSVQNDRVYAVFPYQGMQDGLPYAIVWYYQNEEIIRFDDTWSGGEANRSYAYVNVFAPGTYTFELWIGEAIIISEDFEAVP